MHKAVYGICEISVLSALLMMTFGSLKTKIHFKSQWLSLLLKEVWYVLCLFKAAHCLTEQIAVEKLQVAF